MQIVIIGAGGHGRVVLEIIRAAASHEPAGFVDADPALAGQIIGGLPVLGQANMLGKLRQRGVGGAIVAIGDNRARQRYLELVQEHELEVITAVHPSAVVSPSAVLAAGVVVCAMAVVGTEARVGEGTIINTAAVVDHECVIGRFAHIAPAAVLAGRVRVGERAFIGLGARVIPCLSIAEDATVGAGAVVTRDVPPGVTVVGVPARARPQ
jgi:UDP-perosamine 4-acetyltransferase